MGTPLITSVGDAASEDDGTTLSLQMVMAENTAGLEIGLSGMSSE